MNPSFHLLRSSSGVVRRGQTKSGYAYAYPLVYLFCCFLYLCFCWSDWLDRNSATVAASLLKCYDTINQSVKSVVTSHTHVLARIVLCASLTNNDVTSLSELATI